MNPFGLGMPVASMNELLYRQDAVERLENHIKFKKQTVIMGVEGVGKSSLLQSFFCRDYRIQKAKTDNILISPVTEFPTTIDSDECFYHFTTMVINAVKILGYCDKKDEMIKIQEECEQCKKESRNAQECFKSTMNSIKNNGYRIVMLIDNFERFTTSENITKEHHETLRTLLEYSQYIVATNYDLNKDSLPDDVSGSLFLMNFANNVIRLSGWTKTETEEFIKTQLDGDRIQFSQDLIHKIHCISGGIPTLLNFTASFAYEYIDKYQTENEFMFNLGLYNEQTVQTLLSHWCKMISPEQADALNKLINLQKTDFTDEANLRALRMRGLLNFKTTADRFGRQIIDDKNYEFCCQLLNTFCKDDDKLETAMSKNPLASYDEKENLRKKILRNPFESDKPYIFISYSHRNNRDVYEDICKLKTKYNCWIDFENLDGGRTKNEDDWTEKIKPILSSKKCVGVILYLSPEAMNSNGVLLEAEWVQKENCQFYTFILNFADNLSKDEMAEAVDNITDADPKLRMRRKSAFSYISQATSGFATESFYHRCKDFSHLENTDFINWVEKIFQRTEH